MIRRYGSKPTSRAYRKAAQIMREVFAATGSETVEEIEARLAEKAERVR